MLREKTASEVISVSSDYFCEFCRTRAADDRTGRFWIIWPSLGENLVNHVECEPGPFHVKTLPYIGSADFDVAQSYATRRTEETEAFGVLEGTDFEVKASWTLIEKLIRAGKVKSVQEGVSRYCPSASYLPKVE